MALGKNLKKSKLIPDTPVKKKATTKAVSVEEDLPQESTTPDGTVTQAEYERRRALHQKFHKEIESLERKQVHLIAFEVGGEEYAIDIDKINEVVPTPAITRMPKTPVYISGIANIRGRGIVTIDLAKKLGLVPDERELEGRTNYTIVVDTGRYTVGLLVPNVPHNQRFSGSDIQPASDSVSDTTLDETYIKGLIRVNDRMIFFIDIDELVEGDRLKSRVVKEA
ncbi:chemotaxis protein CheW [Marinoscillum furvescens]|uniref:Purine-binding chemotaxis protein CheW n=1 Tax=Marinoscillum furvescens DSM 4134 TaxID=1122208 RepID=A0A3D9L7B2_MARFU|nr:chemotaxis protein CheW [Marinoscillum furvescens]REE01001.1 purine-binding chemotaxis protein CheW [Marinoscillum furvescens DSM 4134]